MTTLKLLLKRASRVQITLKILGGDIKQLPRWSALHSALVRFVGRCHFSPLANNLLRVRNFGKLSKLRTTRHSSNLCAVGD